MRYLLFWDIWSAYQLRNAYFKPKDHQIIGAPHGATILDKIMKNEAANQKLYCGLIAWVSYVDRFQTWM